MGESDLLRSKETLIFRPGDRNSPAAGADDAAAQKPMVYLEPTTSVSNAMFEHAPVAVMMVDQAAEYGI